MKKFICDYAQKSGFSPYIVYSSLDPQDHLSIKNLLKSKRKIGFLEKKYEEYDGYSIGIVLPEFEFLHYLSSFRYWKKALAQGDIFFGVSGTNQSCLPFVLAKKDFACWIATTLLEDRKYTAGEFSLTHKLIDKFSLPVCLYWEKLIFRKSKKVLVPSRYTARKIFEKYKLDGDKVEVLPYPVDTNLFHPKSSKKDEEKYLLFAGRLNDPRKNLSMLLDAFSIVRRAFPEVKLKLVGDEPDSRLLRKVFELGVGESVLFCGALSYEELVHLYQNATLFVLPSLQEGLGIVTLEAMACGIPVVSTRCGGPEDVIEDGVNGLLVENNSASKLAEAILKLLRDEGLRKRMGKKARQTVVNKYSMVKLAPKFLDFFKELSSGAGQGQDIWRIRR
ncbi:glycosyltransferase family 4 protein [Candidatus Hakubella thermalkaliphila]|nr:glycosyltransferase family 4 protein [Candidatus Hakubella thermalkaliphila]